MTDLKESEIEDAEFAFDIYADDGILDSTSLGTVLRVLKLNPSLESLEKLGATKKKGEKKFKLADFLPIYSECKKEKKDQGCYEDFVECLKLYDKAEDGKMLLAELHHALIALGEKLTEKEVDLVFDDCMGEEDDEGQIEYKRLSETTVHAATTLGAVTLYYCFWIVYGNSADTAPNVSVMHERQCVGTP
ncbi:hypothetical protein FQA39_LY09755 [Lamprigera yunnana]|nr:hypothetical protein FQA39_LY09755 [Lamprigera yunnana]